jgi:hypothetical protein
MRVQIVLLKTKEIIDTPLYLPNLPLVNDLIYIKHLDITGKVHQISYSVSYGSDKFFLPTIYLSDTFSSSPNTL